MRLSFEFSVIFVLGIVSFSSGYFNWDWFMKQARVKPIINFLGEKRTRMFYMILGVILVLVGVVGTAWYQ
jgi:hypothetical protein